MLVPRAASKKRRITKSRATAGWRRRPAPIRPWLPQCGAPGTDPEQQRRDLPADTSLVMTRAGRSTPVALYRIAALERRARNDSDSARSS
jgi:hypothetical protein